MTVKLHIKNFMGGNFTPGIANITPETGNLTANQDRMLRALDMFSQHGTHLALFPEYTLSGAFREQTRANRSHMARASLEALLPWLDAKVMPYITDTLQYIVVNGPVPDGQGRFFNTTLVIDRSGINLNPEHTYRKTFLSGSEKNHMISSLNDTLVLDTPYGRMGFLTCFDICFPQPLTRLVFDHAIDILVVSAAWGRQGERSYPGMDIHEHNFYQLQWEMLLPALATQYQIWILAANGVGPAAKPHMNYCGGSGIWSPSGINMMRASDREEELLILKETHIKAALEMERDAFGTVDNFKAVKALTPDKGNET